MGKCANSSVRNGPVFEATRPKPFAGREATEERGAEFPDIAARAKAIAEHLEEGNLSAASKMIGWALVDERLRCAKAVASHFPVDDVGALSTVFAIGYGDPIESQTRQNRHRSTKPD